MLAQLLGPNHPKRQQVMARVLGPYHQVGRPRVSLGSWFQLGPTPADVGLWGVNQWKKDISLCLQCSNKMKLKILKLELVLSNKALSVSVINSNITTENIFH